MNLLILGATGRTGQKILSLALDQQHHVTALVRNKAKLQVQHPALTVIEGDVLDRNMLLLACQGQDAVISSLGRGQTLRSDNLMTNAVEILIPVMYETNVKRLILLSGFGAGETFEQANFVQKMLFKSLLRNIYADKANAEKKIRNSNLDWTLVYPVVLVDAAQKDTYEAAEKLPMKGMPKISRTQVADFVVSELERKAFSKKNVVLR